MIIIMMIIVIILVECASEKCPEIGREAYLVARTEFVP